MFLRSLGVKQVQHRKGPLFSGLNHLLAQDKVCSTHTGGAIFSRRPSSFVENRFEMGGEEKGGQGLTQF